MSTHAASGPFPSMDDFEEIPGTPTRPAVRSAHARHRAAMDSSPRSEDSTPYPAPGPEASALAQELLYRVYQDVVVARSSRPAGVAAMNQELLSRITQDFATPVPPAPAHGPHASIYDTEPPPHSGVRAIAFDADVPAPPSLPREAEAYVAAPDTVVDPDLFSAVLEDLAADAPLDPSEADAFASAPTRFFRRLRAILGF